MHDEDVATTAKRWSPESVIHDRVFRQNASMCYDILLWVAVHSHFHHLAVVATTCHTKRLDRAGVPNLPVWFITDFSGCTTRM